MKTSFPLGRMRAGLAACLFVCFGLLAGAAEPIVPEPLPNSGCMDCHEAEFRSPKRGQPKEWIGVRPEVFAGSVHRSLNCVDCHDSIKEEEHSMSLPPAQCASCHESAVTQFDRSIHGMIAEPGKAPPADCLTCHGAAHAILGAKHADSLVFKFNLPTTCGQCHEDEKTATALGLGKKNTIAEYRDSIHGQALYKMGLLVAPSCNDCHGVHDIHAISDPTARTSKASLAGTCGTCHYGIEQTYGESVHGQLLLKSDELAPTCIDCHTAHTIERPTNGHFKANSDRSCGKCHEDRLENYHETYHGKAMALGRTDSAPEVAACFDCHGHHDVFPVSDARSLLSAQKIVGTCAQCHTGVTPSFTQYQPHADPTDRVNYRGLNNAYLLMTGLLVGVFAFGIHTLLWVIRAFIAYARDPVAFRAARTAARNDAETYRRFEPFERFLHMMVVTSFLLLVLTGMPLKFYYTDWARILFALLGGPTSARVLHHLAAIITFLYFALHLGRVGTKLWRNRGAVRDPASGRISLGRIWQAVFGPDSMVPSWQDFRDIVAHFRWFLGRGPKPQWDRWTYWERFDYLAVFWGVGIIGLSGLVLWFPAFFTQFLPGWVINIAQVIHSDEALLAAGFIFTFHFFNTHFRIDRFPMDTVIFSGRISKSEMLHERRKWYDRLKAEGRLEQHRVVHDDWAARRTTYRTLGFIFLATGLILLALMIYAMISRLGH